MKHDLNAVGKLTDITNIKFDYYLPAASTTQVDKFVNNVLQDLKLRGYDVVGVLNGYIAERVEMLCNHLDVALIVKECQSSFRINEDALAKQILNPGKLPPCCFRQFCHYMYLRSWASQAQVVFQESYLAR